MSVWAGRILKFFCGVTSTKDQKKGCNVIVPLQACIKSGTLPGDYKDGHFPGKIPAVSS